MMKGIMDRRRGILLPETLKMVLGALCIVALIYLAVTLGGIFFGKTRLDQARATLGQMIDKVSGLKEGEHVRFIALAPDGWQLVSKGTGNEIKECNFQQCLCICEQESCEGLNACRIYKWRFVLKDFDGVEREYLKDKLPVEYDLSLNKGNVTIQVAKK